MRNKATNPDYVLPDVLKPTALQISTPHDFRIDGFLFAGMRDRMILNTEYDLDDIFADLVDNATVHPGEVRFCSLMALGAAPTVSNSSRSSLILETARSPRASCASTSQLRTDQCVQQGLY